MKRGLARCRPVVLIAYQAASYADKGWPAKCVRGCRALCAVSQLLNFASDLQGRWTGGAVISEATCAGQASRSSGLAESQGSTRRWVCLKTTPRAPRHAQTLAASQNRRPVPARARHAAKQVLPSTHKVALHALLLIVVRVALQTVCPPRLVRLNLCAVGAGATTIKTGC